MRSNLKGILAKNPKVNGCLLEESLKLTRKLSKTGVTIRKDFDVPNPFEKRLVKTTAAEILSLLKEEE